MINAKLEMLTKIAPKKNQVPNTKHRYLMGVTTNNEYTTTKQNTQIQRTYVPCNLLFVF